MLTNEDSGVFTDLWTLGVILYEMACGVTPFYSENEQQMYEKIKTRDFEFPSNFQDENLKSLIDSLLQLDPRKRLGMKGHSELKNHPFFADIDWPRLKRHSIPVPAYEIIRNPSDPSKI